VPADPATETLLRIALTESRHQVAWTLRRDLVVAADGLHDVLATPQLLPDWLEELDRTSKLFGRVNEHELKRLSGL